MKILVLLESYSAIRHKFVDNGENIDDVNHVLSQYKKLNNNHKIKGQEKDINFWTSKSFSNFKNFVQSIIDEPTRTQIKRRRAQGKYITLIDNNEYLIVVPLNLEASCFYGKNTKWCTTKETKSYFSDYTRRNMQILVYIIKKDNNEKYALIYDPINDFTEYYNADDVKILRGTFTSETGIDPTLIINMVKSKPIRMEIRDILNKTRNDDIHFKLGKLYKGIRDTAIEKAILKYASPEMAYTYVNRTNIFPQDMLSLIAKSPKYSYDYAYKYTHGEGFPEGESAISTNADYSYAYAKNILHGQRFKAGEPAIINKPKVAEEYAQDIILGRFPEGESSIATDGYASFEYAMNVLHHRFPEGEIAIKHNKSDWELYKQQFQSEFK